MKQKKPIGVRILQVFAILFLIVAVLSSALYFVVSGSISTANKNQTIPELFGHQWVAISDEKFETGNLVSMNSLVLLEDIDSASVVAGDVVVYDTPADASDNAVYKTFSMGRVSSVDASTGETMVQIRSLTTGSDLSVAGTSIVGKATTEIVYLGKVFNAIGSSLGLIMFVVFPFFVFIVLQLVVLILRILTGRSGDEDEEEDDEDDEESKQKKERAEKQRKAIEAHNSKRGKYLEQEPLESMSLNFKNKKDGTSQTTEIKSQTVSTVVDGEYAAEVPNANDAAELDQTRSFDFSMDEVQQPAAMPNFDTSAPSYDVPAETESSVSSYDSENTDYTPYLDANAYSDASAQVDEFLRSLNYNEASLEHELMSQSTIEFDMDAIRERLLKEELLKDVDDKDFVKMPETQDMLDNILIELKDNAVDFSFQNIKSDDVEIEENNVGDGFSIETPNYRANIKVEIDKK